MTINLIQTKTTNIYLWKSDLSKIKVAFKTIVCKT